MKMYENDNLKHYEKFNLKNRYRLMSYDNYKEHKGYYILTEGKYKIIYASISFKSMYDFIKENNIPFHIVHLNNMTFEDLFDYMTFEEEENERFRI